MTSPLADFSIPRLLNTSTRGHAVLPSCRLAVLVVLLLALAPGASWSAPVAELELGHAGDIGGHGLTDTLESPGATCRFALPLVWSRGETWIQVRPPIIFARDASDRTDEQLVGWRAVVLTLDEASSAWREVTAGSTERAIAADNRSAPFDSRGPGTQFFVGYGAYLVTTDLFWYDRLTAGEEPRLAGQAEYQITNYAIAVRDRAGTHPLGVSVGCQLEP
jgi:hypothetical protein